MIKMVAPVALALLFLSTANSAAVPDTNESAEALRECGNMHDLNVRSFANSSGEYVNGECALSCIIDGRPFPLVTINEGAVCPLNIRGHCKHGHCMLPPIREPHNDPMRECANLNHVEWHLFNSSQTDYEAGQCKVLCYIKGELASEHNLNSGYPCWNGRANGSGICTNGQCVISGHTPSTPTPTPHTKSPIDVPNFEDIYISLVNSTFVSAKLSNTNPVQLITDGSLCVKGTEVRKYEGWSKCTDNYCTSLHTPCITKLNERPHFFMFNVWSMNSPGSTSLGDVFLSLEELFEHIKESSTGYKLKAAALGKRGELSTRLTTTLYKDSLVVGDITLDLLMLFESKKLLF